LDRIVVALEGLIHAGKTTLLHTLGQKLPWIVSVEEYSEFTRERFPSIPITLVDVEKAWSFFLELESERQTGIAHDAIVVLLDRSVLSILAYNFAIEQLNKALQAFSWSLKTLCCKDWLFPTVCIYLDISDKEIHNRHLTEISYYQRILLDSVFNAAMRNFYSDKMLEHFPSLQVFRIDACQDLKSVHHEALCIIEALLKKVIK